MVHWPHSVTGTTSPDGAFDDIPVPTPDPQADECAVVPSRSSRFCHVYVEFVNCVCFL